MPLLTIEQVRDQVQTDLTDAALGKVYDAELRRIVKEVGAEKAVVETKRGLGLVELFTRRPIATINSIKERTEQNSDQVTLAADDFRIVGNRQIIRLSTGTNSATFWGIEAVIDYDPVDNIDLRNSTLIELIRIAMDISLKQSEKDGDYSAAYRSPKRAREEALAGLNDTLEIA